MVEQAQTTQSTDAVAKRQRRPRGANVAGGTLRLDAPQRDGYVRRFVVNSPSRIQEMERLGYQMANDKAGVGNTRTEGLGTRIERLGGTDAQGAPQGMVLMETPVEEYTYGQSDKLEALKPFEEAIRAGRDTTGRMTDAYNTGASSIK